MKLEAALGLEFRCELRNSLTIQILFKPAGLIIGPWWQLIIRFEGCRSASPLTLLIHGNTLVSLSVKHFSYTVGPDQFDKIDVERREILIYGDMRDGRLRCPE